VLWNAGHIFSWLSYISIKSQELRWKLQQTLPSSVHLGLCHLSPRVSGRQELKGTQWALACHSISVSAWLRGFSSVEHLYFGVTNISAYPRLPLCTRNHLMVVCWPKKKKKNKNMVWHRKEAPLFKVSQLPWDYPELQIKPQAESDMSAGTEKIPCHFCQPLIWKRRLCLGGLRSSQMICSQCSCGRWRGRLCAPNTVPGWRWTEH
jgi:hypothetical protein